MPGKNTIKKVRSLHQKKYRQKLSMFIAEGEKTVLELLQSGRFGLENLFILENCQENSKIEKIKQHQHEPALLKEISQMSAFKTPANVLAVFKMHEEQLDNEKLDDIFIVLEDINDPGNHGTIIRIADWFGVKNVICSKNTVDLYNPKTIQATMGSIARVNVFYKELTTFFKELNKDIPVYGTFTNGDNIYHTELNNKGAILIGNESKGISEELTSFVSKKLSIPSYPEGDNSGAESLNASIATAIVCAEFRRRCT